MENEEEDEEQRRERILAEENGQDLGAALGIVLGLASTLLEDEDPLPQEEGPCFYYVSVQEAALTKREITKSLKEYPAALTVKELAEILRVSTKTVYKLLKEGALPACKVGRENRVAKVELVNFLRERDKRGTNPKCVQTDNS